MLMQLRGLFREARYVGIESHRKDKMCGSHISTGFRV